MPRGYGEGQWVEQPQPPEEREITGREPVSVAEPAAPQQLRWWLGSAVAEVSGKEGSDGGARAGAVMLS